MHPQCLLQTDHTHLRCNLCGRASSNLHRAYRLHSAISKVKLFCSPCMSLVERRRLERSSRRKQCKPRRGQPYITTLVAISSLLPNTKHKVMNEDQRIAVCMTSVRQIYDMLHTSPSQWRSFLTLARSVMAHIDATTFMRQSDRTTEQAWLITGLQRLAFADIDTGGVADIASWCSQQWLILFQRDSTNVAALRGIGQAWLSRAQPALARIHRTEGSGSSSGGSQRSAPSMTSDQEAALSAQQSTEAERRAGTADFVEARGYLLPATEYLERAVSAATARRELSGDLLATAAEAYMSLGNASSPRVNEPFFRRAIELLRAASTVPGYTLTRYLQQYLDDYGRVIE